MLSLVKKIFPISKQNLSEQLIEQSTTKSVPIERDFLKLITVEAENTRDKRLKKTIATLDECSSDDLNYLVAELLKAMGYEAKIFDGVNDRGIDVVAFEEGKMTIAAQCKAWNPKKNTERVGVKDIQAFKGQFITEYAHGVFITTHYFTEPAWAEANDRYHLVDRKRLFDLIARYFPQHLSTTLYNETLSTLPACKKCNSGRLLRLFSQKGSYYYWCESCEENTYS